MTVTVKVDDAVLFPAMVVTYLRHSLHVDNVARRLPGSGAGQSVLITVVGTDHLQGFAAAHCTSRFATS